MSTLADQDAFVVNRAGVNHQAAAADLMSTIADTDLLAVNRGGTNFKVTGLDLKNYAGGSGPGSNWTPPGGATGLPATGLSNPALVHNNGVWLLYTPYSTVNTYYTSVDDGETWTARAWPWGGTDYYPVAAAGNGKFVAHYTRSPSISAYQSTDGVTWTYAGTVLNNAGNQTTINSGVMTYGGNTWWSVLMPLHQYSGEMGVNVYKSTDLVTWTNTAIYLSYTYGDSQYTFIRPAVAAANSSSINVSGIYRADNTYYQVANAGDLTASPKNPPAIPVAGAYVTSGVNTKCHCVAGQNNIIAFLNDSNVLTSAKVFTDIRGTLTTVYPSVGFNQIYSSFYNSAAGAICAAGSGGAISMSYDDGLTWTPSYKQYEAAGVSQITFTGAASSPTVGMLVASKPDGSLLLLRSTF